MNCYYYYSSLLLRIASLFIQRWSSVGPAAVPIITYPFIRIYTECILCVTECGASRRYPWRLFLEGGGGGGSCGVRFLLPCFLLFDASECIFATTQGLGCRLYLLVLFLVKRKAGWPAGRPAGSGSICVNKEAATHSPESRMVVCLLYYRHSCFRNAGRRARQSF